MKTVPYFGHSHSGDKKAGGILGIKPGKKASIGSWFLRLADRVRVEHEVHDRTGLTRSSGIRGGCQSVVNRIESCHALSFCMERRASAFRRLARAGRFKEVPLRWCAVSHPNNSRACRSDSLLTFLTASSTLLILNTVAEKSTAGKPVLRSVRAKTRVDQWLFSSLEYRFLDEPVGSKYLPASYFEAMIIGVSLG